VGELKWKAVKIDIECELVKVGSDSVGEFGPMIGD
jgi:hypothetical protein